MNDRQEKIYHILSELGSASIASLKTQIYASEATLRRDLAQMEQEGLLIRTWGGAVSAAVRNSDPPVFVRDNTNVAAKNAIAQKAAEFVEDHMTLFLASGTTVARLAKLLHRCRDLTCITNSLENAKALREHLSAKIILPGGELYEQYDLIGSLAENTLSQFYGDLCFFSCSGITAEGFSGMDLQRVSIIDKMRQNSRKVILLADTSKVGKQFTYKGFGFEGVDHVIMEKDPKDAALKKALGKKLILAKG